MGTTKINEVQFQELYLLADGSRIVSGDLTLAQDARIGGGLYVGAIDVDPPTGVIWATDAIIAGDGSGYGYMGAMASAASNSDLIWWSGADIAAIFRRTANDDIEWLRYNPAGTAQGTALTFKSSNGDIYSVPWTDYSGTSSVVGWASFLSKKIYYKRIGKTVFVQFEIAGTSGGANGTVATFTLPYSQTNATGSLVIIARIMNNGTYDNSGHYILTANSGTVNVYKGAQSAAWTATGSKRVYGAFRYQIG